MAVAMTRKFPTSISLSTYQLDIFADIQRVAERREYDRESSKEQKESGEDSRKSVKKGVVDIVWNEDKRLVAVFWQCVMDRKEDELLRVNKAMTQYWETEQYRVVIKTIVELLSYVEKNWLVGVMKSCL